MNFERLADVKEHHWTGSLITFNDKLTVIAGWRTVNVRVLDNISGEWNASTIHVAPDEFSSRIRLSSLVVPDSGTDILFIFGESLNLSSLRGQSIVIKDCVMFGNTRKLDGSVKIIFATDLELVQFFLEISYFLLVVPSMELIVPVIRRPKLNLTLIL